ncbi:MAG: glycosyltransferase family 2 protein, partial [Gluconacetobacter diazotrophicus]|nr:glycosyltransferase family 2 protein [Gluconacetobacter diazotrophicus]
MRAPLAVVTMVYNEAAMLPVWLRHYAAAVGAGNCL